MKKIFSLIVLLLSLFNIESLAFTKYITTNLNLRYEASTNSRILIVIPRGTAVTIDEDCDCKWVPVEYKGYVGYISTKYLSNDKPIKKYTSTRNSSTRRQYTSTRSRRGEGVGYYTNTYGNRVQSPTYYDTRPAGATALCRDGTYSFSQSRRGTCSHHGGVARWY